MTYWKVVTVEQDQSADLVKIYQMIMGTGKDREKVDFFCLRAEGSLLPSHSDSLHQSCWSHHSVFSTILIFHLTFLFLVSSISLSLLTQFLQLLVTLIMSEFHFCSLLFFGMILSLNYNGFIRPSDQDNLILSN